MARTRDEGPVILTVGPDEKAERDLLQRLLRSFPQETVSVNGRYTPGSVDVQGKAPMRSDRLAAWVDDRLADVGEQAGLVDGGVAGDDEARRGEIQSAAARVQAAVEKHAARPAWLRAVTRGRYQKRLATLAEALESTPEPTVPNDIRDAAELTWLEARDHWSATGLAVLLPAVQDEQTVSRAQTNYRAGFDAAVAARPDTYAAMARSCRAGTVTLDEFRTFQSGLEGPYVRHPGRGLVTPASVEAYVDMHQIGPAHQRAAAITQFVGMRGYTRIEEYHRRDRLGRDYQPRSSAPQRTDRGSERWPGSRLRGDAAASLRLAEAIETGGASRLTATRGDAARTGEGHGSPHGAAELR